MQVREQRPQGQRKILGLSKLSFWRDGRALARTPDDR